MKEEMSVEIIEFYKEYDPPVDVQKVIKRLLNTVPPKYLINLKSVTLTNSENLNAKRKKGKTKARKRKVKISKCRGLYHGWNKNTPARIELFVDNIIPSDAPKFALKIPLIIDIFISEVLYHEIGHHIHNRMIPEFKEREDVADKWGNKLARRYMRKRHWLVWILLWPIFRVRKLIKRIKKNRANQRVEPTVKTPVESGKAQGTAAHS